MLSRQVSYNSAAHILFNTLVTLKNDNYSILKIINSLRNFEQETNRDVKHASKYNISIFDIFPASSSSNVIALLVFSEVTLLALMVPNPCSSRCVIGSVTLFNASNIKCRR